MMVKVVLLLMNLGLISAILPVFFRQRVLPILTLPLLVGTGNFAFAIEDTKINNVIQAISVTDGQQSLDQVDEEKRRIAKKLLLQQKASDDDNYVNKLKKEQLKQESRKKSKVQRSKDLCETLGIICLFIDALFYYLHTSSILHFRTRVLIYFISKIIAYFAVNFSVYFVRMYGKKQIQIKFKINYTLLTYI